MSQHKGCSFRTNNPVTNPEKSNILDHSLIAHHPINLENFKILASCDKLDLRLLESLFIHKLKPSLNDQHRSTDLLIVNNYVKHSQKEFNFKMNIHKKNSLNDIHFS